MGLRGNSGSRGTRADQGVRPTGRRVLQFRFTGEQTGVTGPKAVMEVAEIRHLRIRFYRLARGAQLHAERSTGHVDDPTHEI
jgi:hypothetical protein